MEKIGAAVVILFTVLLIGSCLIPEYVPLSYDCRCTTTVKTLNQAMQSLSNAVEEVHAKGYFVIEQSLTHSWIDDSFKIDVKGRNINSNSKQN